MDKSNRYIKCKTLGELKKAGYQPKSIKEEMRQNLLHALEEGVTLFEGIYGYDETVIPDLERAVLSRHNILLLGLRGQAKTKIARLCVRLLDEYIPVIVGSELNEDPFEPLTKTSRAKAQELGDSLPIEWMHRSNRYVEKLATPDVSISDLIGDIDPIKAASKKLSYSDEEVIHYGLVPRSNRCIFVLNELPDLQPRIQVSLFNILQEGDIQIRGFKLRLPLHIQFVFTANPEDYTNRGSIITPLKDRIESQILTHYPVSIETAKSITKSEARIHPSQMERIRIPELHRTLLETLVVEARQSDFIDEKSGVSARLGISGLENLYSSVERRMIKNKEKSSISRIQDFWGVIPAVTGKLELVYEGEQEGPYQVALHLLGRAIRAVFLNYFPDPSAASGDRDPYGVFKAYFGDGHTVTLPNDVGDSDFQNALQNIPGLEKFVKKYGIADVEKTVFMELVLHGLAEFQIIEKSFLNNIIQFKDPLSDIFDEIKD